MEEVIHYLELKNQYYSKFYSVTLRFLDRTNRNDWDEMGLFVDNRERILNIIRSFDYKIADRFQNLCLPPNELACYRSRVKELLDTRRDLAHKIVALDLELISKMEEIKSETIRELKKNFETSSQLNSFAGGASAKRSLKPRRDV